MGLAERTGRGIDRIFEGYLIYGRPCPDYSESSSESVRVFFPKCEADIEFVKSPLIDVRGFLRLYSGGLPLLRSEIAQPLESLESPTPHKV